MVALHSTVSLFRLEGGEADMDEEKEGEAAEAAEEQRPPDQENPVDEKEFVPIYDE